MAAGGMKRCFSVSRRAISCGSPVQKFTIFLPEIVNNKISRLALADGEYCLYNPALEMAGTARSNGNPCPERCVGGYEHMPIYVYERPDGSRFEIRQGFNDPHLTADPETGVPVRRVLQPAPIIFKGSGWYKTDSRASSAPKAEADKTEKAATATEATAEKVAEKTAE